MPFTAGSATDIAGRIVFEQVGKQIGQNFVFENRGGAGTTLGAAMVAKADPDGYTLLVNSTSQVVVASTYAKLPYSVADDFIPISGLADIPFVVSTTTKYKSMKDVMAAGSKPGGIFYGTNGPGSSGHLFMEALRLAAGYPITHVPFRGTVEAMTEVIAGRIDMFPAPALNAINLTKEGKVSSLAVSSPKRLALMPDVADLGRDRPAQGAVSILGRRLRAGQDAEADHRAAQPRGCRGLARQGDRRQDHRARRQPDADDARRVRRVRAEGNRAERRNRQGFGLPAAIVEMSRSGAVRDPVHVQKHRSALARAGGFACAGRLQREWLNARDRAIQANTQPPGPSYKADIVAFMRTYLNDPTGVRDAFISEPALRTLESAERYAVCLRYTARKPGSDYAASKDSLVLFRDGRLDRIIDAARETCKDAAYQPFPELQRLSR